jgi:hypothetical protein
MNQLLINVIIPHALLMAKDEIKSIILVQWPIDLDTACSLALLQEEAQVSHRREYRRPNHVVKPKVYSSPAPLPCLHLPNQTSQ